MRTTARALATAALVTAVSAALAACGGAPDPAPAAADAPAAANGPAAPVAAASGPTGDEGAVETVFRDYYRALLARDFAAACVHNSPEATAELLANLRERGVTAATCEEGFRLLYGVPGAAATYDAVANSATVQDVTVTGDDAAITWSADINGGRPTVTSGLRRVDGGWLLVDAG
jgi:hypothetical protein